MAKKSAQAELLPAAVPDTVIEAVVQTLRAMQDGATLQFAHAGSCEGGDVYVRRVAVFVGDGGAVVYEFNAVRFITARDPSEPRVPLRTSLDAFVRSVELR